MCLELLRRREARLRSLSAQSLLSGRVLLLVPHRPHPFNLLVLFASQSSEQTTLFHRDVHHGLSPLHPIAYFKVLTMSIDLSSRRGSAASSITIQVSTSTASSLPTFDISDERIAPLPTFKTSTTIEPFPLAQADQSQPPSPPPFPEAPSSPNEETVNLEAGGPEASPPPPPYQFPGPPPPLSSSSINPLSFYTYPFSTLTPVTSTFPPQPSSLPENESSLPPPPPPEYNEVPQTLAERCFVFGFLCPFLWIIGITKYWYSERPVGFAEKNQRHKEDEGDLESGVAVPSEEMERIEESLDNWREEEKLWSLRCAWCLGGVTSLGVLGGIIVAAVMGKL